MEKISIYGIGNCDITKKAVSWFKENKFDVHFHDYKKAGISKEKLSEWIDRCGLENILNKRSTTWRDLPLASQKKITDSLSAIKCMIENNSIIKRPVIEYNEKIFTGFNENKFLDEIIHK